MQIINLLIGTAFLIAPNTYMTADHIVSTPMAQAHARYSEVEILEQNTLLDTAKVTYKGDGEPLEIECRNVTIGEELTIKGYPFVDGQYTYTEIPAKVIGETIIYENRPTTILEANIIGGFSGSPVLDKDGDVVGIVTDRGEYGIGFMSSPCGQNYKITI